MRWEVSIGCVGGEDMHYEINCQILPQVRLVEKAVLEPPYVHKRRCADEYILYIMLKGVLFLQENGKKYILKEGDMILLDPEFEHEGIKASECEYYYIHFRHPGIRRCDTEDDFLEMRLRQRNESLQEDNGSWERYQDSKICFPKYISLRMGTVYLKVCNFLQEAIACNCNQLEAYKSVCACRILEMLIEISREQLTTQVGISTAGTPQSYRKVHDLLRYLNANYAEDISGDGIEESFDCNFDYLNRIFKRIVGKTIFVYLNEIRIQHAKKLLGTTSMKISAISYRVGFKDESYFNKVFKKQTGMTPGQYERYSAGTVEEQRKMV